MKTPPSLVLAFTLAPSAASKAQHAIASNKSTSSSASLRGASSSAPRHLQVPSNEICFTHLGYYPDDATYPYETDCTQEFLSKCGPFDAASNCVAGADEEGDDFVFTYLGDAHCPTFVVGPTGDSACAWAYACC